MPDGFWLGVTSMGAVVVFVLVLRRLWPTLQWRLPEVRYIIPPPAVGRWQVWRISSYPAGGEVQVGRYRLRVNARIVTWSLNRSEFNPAYRYEVRRNA